VNEYCPQGVNRGVPCGFEQSTTAIGSTSLTDCECKEGYYLKKLNDTTLSCIACSDTSPGLECSEPGASLEALPLMPGYWRSSNLSEDVRTCFTADACVGAPAASQVNHTTWLYCANGHMGAYCEVCLDDFFKGSDDLCVECGGSMAAALIFPILFLLALILAMVWFCRRRNDAGLLDVVLELENALYALDEGVDAADYVQDRIQEEVEARVAQAQDAAKAAAIEKVKAAAEAAAKHRLQKKDIERVLWLQRAGEKVGNKLRILVSLVQVLTPLGIVYSIPFPNIFDSMLRWLNVFELNLIEVMPLACIFDTSYHSTLLLRTLLPLAVLAILYFIREWAVRKAEAKSKTHEADAFFFAWVKDGTVTVAFFLLFLIYPSTSQNIFYAFQCLSIDDGRNLLRADLSIDCDSAAHWGFWFYALLMMFVYPFGTPALYFCILWYHSDEVDELKYLEQCMAINEQQRMNTVPRATSDSGQTASAVVLRKTASSALDNRRESFANVAPKNTDLALEGRKLKALYNTKRAKLPDYLRKLVGAFEFRVYWFEIAECFRKLMLVGAPVFFDPPGSVQQLIYGLMTCFLIFGAYAYWQPYVDDDDDTLATICQAQIFFTLLASVINAFDDGTLRGNYNIGALLVVLTLAPAAIAIYQETPLRHHAQELMRSKMMSQLTDSVKSVLPNKIKEVGKVEEPVTTSRA